jgi:hypothetical protein
MSTPAEILGDDRDDDFADKFVSSRFAAHFQHAEQFSDFAISAGFMHYEHDTKMDGTVSFEADRLEDTRPTVRVRFACLEINLLYLYFAIGVRTNREIFDAPGVVRLT